MRRHHEAGFEFLDRLAGTLEYLAHGHTWTAVRVCSIRNGHGIAAYREGERQERGELTVDEAAAVLRVVPTTVLRLIHRKALLAKQACPNAPWTIRQADLDELVATRAEQSPSAQSAGQLALDIQ